MSPRKTSGGRDTESPATLDTTASTPIDSVKSNGAGMSPSPSIGTIAPSTPSASSAPAADADAESPVVSPPPDPEESRPGLGPMIKSKKSKGDLAGTLWKAATAASVFKPRPGGAGERLRSARNKGSDGPDGITEVVPAPPRPTSVPKDAAAAAAKAVSYTHLTLPTKA